MKKNLTIVWVSVLLTTLALTVDAADAPKPKYGPNAKPLSARTNQDYFKKNDAPDYWALAPYYMPQETPRGCSAGNLAMLMNASRVGMVLTSSDELITFKSFIDKFADSPYQEAITMKSKTTGENFSNKNLTRLLAEALSKLQIPGAAPTVELYIVDPKDKKKAKADFLAALKTNEASAQDFIFFSFMQGTVTGDPDGGAHVATVAAYDRGKNLVLVMDPDRQWYEPYWVSVDVLLDATSDPKSDSRKEAGWMHVKLNKRRT